ncbi:hypothetical protein O3597_25790 [Verrucosispora sp. WMMA2044]|uniref:hypothetical protein n=1 Tax=Verrucosispora sp. WMMA2044 TaxID=3016419 RepID=UPI00248AD24C|nr:hypothetical protein [Verrucosispora sp. WMMA2044]WBB48454.1 hypothetical protein O3597_25790 [Verrucosispora sp. WMMA2044]
MTAPMDARLCGEIKSSTGGSGQGDPVDGQVSSRCRIDPMGSGFVGGTCGHLLKRMVSCQMVTRSAELTPAGTWYGGHLLD